MPISTARSLCSSLLLASLVGGSLITLSGCGNSSGPPPKTAIASDEAPPAPDPAQTAPVPTPAKPPVPESQRVPDELASVPSLILGGKSSQALNLLTDYITKHPTDPRAYSLRGGLYTQVQKRTEALADLTKVVELSPGDADALHSRGLFYLMQGPQESARADFEQALKHNPAHIEAANHLGLMQLSSGEFLPAIDSFKIAIVGAPQNAHYLNNRGLAYWRAGNHELARADFDAAVQLNPRDANPYSNRGQLSLVQKKFEDAVSDFSHAIANDPYNIAHYRFRHAAYLKLGRLIDADNNGRRIVWLRNLFKLQAEIQKNPGDLALQLRLGRHFLQERDDQLALKIFNGILAADSQHADALIGRAQVAHSRQEYQKVIDDCSALLKSGESFEARSLRGDAFFQLRKFDEAITDFEAAKRFDRQVADAYYQRSQQRTNAGDQAGAEADLAKYKQFAPRLQTADAAE